jgi:hypothetical protein
MGRKPLFRWDRGAGATVAKDPEPGQDVRHGCGSRCGTDLPDFHNFAGSTRGPRGESDQTCDGWFGFGSGCACV